MEEKQKSNIMQEFEKNKVGAPTKYNENYNEKVYKLCLLGATDKDIADFFDVSESTINNWKLEYPEFLESIKNGKKIADMHLAEKLKNKAEGAIIKTQQAFKKKRVYYDDNGKRCEEEEIEIIDLEQEQPPDTTALIFWLKNRNPEFWRDKQVIEQDSNITISWNEEKTYEK